MALTPNFTISQSSLAPNVITATDTSTGSDGSIVARQIYFQTATGDYLTENGVTPPNYNQWPLANVSQAFDVLDEDQSLVITVKWVDSGGATVVELSQIFCFPAYNKQFFYYLLQQQALSPGIIQDTNYYSNLTTYWVNIIGAIQAIEIGADVAASQNCLNRATDMMNNQTKYF